MEDTADANAPPTDSSDFASWESALKLVEQSLKSSPLSLEEFLEKQAATQAANSHAFHGKNQPMTLASAGKELQDNFLKALAEREEANRSGKMNSIIFIRDHNTVGQEVSGYIDYAHRLKTQDFEPYFSRKKRLMPGRWDLSYYNWNTRVCMSNSSPNFEVIYNNPNDLLFKSSRDRKVLSVDPLANEFSNRTFLHSDLYIHVVIYDHNFRTV